MGITHQPITKITKWVYDGVEYDTEEDAALAAAVILLKVPLDAQELVMMNMKENARDLVTILQKLCGPKTRTHPSNPDEGHLS